MQGKGEAMQRRGDAATQQRSNAASSTEQIHTIRRRGRQASSHNRHGRDKNRAGKRRRGATCRLKKPPALITQLDAMDGRDLGPFHKTSWPLDRNWKSQLARRKVGSRNGVCDLVILGRVKIGGPAPPKLWSRSTSPISSQHAQSGQGSH